MKSFKEFVKEDAVPVNSAGSGNVPAIGIGPDGEPPMKMALVRRKPMKQKKEKVK